MPRHDLPTALRQGHERIWAGTLMKEDNATSWGRRKRRIAGLRSNQTKPAAAAVYTEKRDDPIRGVFPAGEKDGQDQGTGEEFHPMKIAQMHRHCEETKPLQKKTESATTKPPTHLIGGGPAIADCKKN